HFDLQASNLSFIGFAICFSVAVLMPDAVPLPPCPALLRLKESHYVRRHTQSWPARSRPWSRTTRSVIGASRSVLLKTSCAKPFKRLAILLRRCANTCKRKERVQAFIVATWARDAGTVRI